MFDFGLDVDGQEDRRNYSSSSMSTLLFIGCLFETCEPSRGSTVRRAETV
jgi:hypothetical protein